MQSSVGLLPRLQRSLGVPPYGYAHSRLLARVLLASEPRSAGQFGCDSPETLVTSMIADMKLTTPNPAFVIVSGDSAAHDMTESDTLASVRFVMASLQAAYPGVPLYPVVGAAPHHLATLLCSHSLR